MLSVSLYPQTMLADFMINHVHGTYMQLGSTFLMTAAAQAVTVLAISWVTIITSNITSIVKPIVANYLYS